MTEENDYQQDIAIDPHDLDGEWLNQPILLFEYSQMHADAKRKKDKLSETLAYTRAKLDLDIRENPNAFGLKKVTEGAIAAKILTIEKYRQANEDFIQATYRLNVLAGAVQALEHKKKALENLVTLLMCSYFAGPKEPKKLAGGKRMVDIAKDKIQAQAIEQAKGLQQKRRRQR